MASIIDPTLIARYQAQAPPPASLLDLGAVRTQLARERAMQQALSTARTEDERQQMLMAMQQQWQQAAMGGPIDPGGPGGGPSLVAGSPTAPAPGAASSPGLATMPPAGRQPQGVAGAQGQPDLARMMLLDPQRTAQFLQARALKAAEADSQNAWLHNAIGTVMADPSKYQQMKKDAQGRGIPLPPDLPDTYDAGLAQYYYRLTGNAKEELELGRLKAQTDAERALEQLRMIQGEVAVAGEGRQAAESQLKLRREGLKAPDLGYDSLDNYIRRVAPATAQGAPVTPQIVEQARALQRAESRADTPRLRVESEQGQSLVDPFRGESIPIYEPGQGPAPGMAPPAGPQRMRAPLTESQGKAYSYATSAIGGYTILQELMQKGFGPSAAGTVAGDVPLLSRLASEDQQRWNQAVNQITDAVLRDRTGAVIGGDEAARKKRELIPLADDKPAVVQQKLRALGNDIQAIVQRTGRPEEFAEGLQRLHAGSQDQRQVVSRAQLRALAQRRSQDLGRTVTPEEVLRDLDSQRFRVVD